MKMVFQKFMLAALQRMMVDVPSESQSEVASYVRRFATPWTVAYQAPWTR